MRRFYDPSTAATVSGVLLQSVEQFSEGNAASAEAKQRIEGAKLQRDRDLSDLRRRDEAKLSRQRAVAAATGNDLAFGQTAEILATSEALAAKGQRRVLQDFDFQRQVLKGNAQVARTQGLSRLMFGTVAAAGVGASKYIENGGDVKKLFGSLFAKPGHSWDKPKP